MALAESPAPGRCCGLDHYALLTMMPRFGAAIMLAAIGSTMHPETFRGYEYCASVEKRRFGFHTGFSACLRPRTARHPPISHRHARTPQSVMTGSSACHISHLRPANMLFFWRRDYARQRARDSQGRGERHQAISCSSSPQSPAVAHQPESAV